MSKLEQNSVTDMMNQGIDLAPRWKEILEEIALKAGFVPDEQILSKSQWWKRPGKVGAVHCPGFLMKEGLEERAVLKIQGTKPQTSEVVMIEEFGRQNRSRIIRPPRIFWSQPWDEEKQYEAFIMEETDGNPVIVNHPATERELKDFFDLYSEYKENCILQPWVSRPTTDSYRDRVVKWMKATEVQRKTDKFGLPSDTELMEKAIIILEKNLGLDDLKFMHGHFQPGDLIVGPSGEVVLFSNLFWGWKIPFYDAVFGYHWWVLGTEHAKGFSQELLDKERKHWLDKIYSLPQIKEYKDGEKLINLALLERAIPALMVDRYMLDQSKPSAEIIAKSSRKELQRLIDELM